MNKKEIISPILIIGISALFAFICFMIFMNKGKSEKWIARKIMVGGILLSLTASINSCKIKHTCYVAPAEKGIEISGLNSNNELIINNNRILNGKLIDWQSQYATFIVLNDKSGVVQKGIINPKDGKLDSVLEEVKFSISNDIASGSYNLMIYDTEQSKTNKDYYIHKFKLIVEL